MLSGNLIRKGKAMSDPKTRPVVEILRPDGSWTKLNGRFCSFGSSGSMTTIDVDEIIGPRIADGQLTGEITHAGRRFRWTVPSDAPEGVSR